MREIHVREITETVARLCQEANYELCPDVRESLLGALEKEESPVGREILEQLVRNAEIAQKNKVPVCQDTGMAVVFLEIGSEVCIVGGDLTEAINQGVRKGYTDGYLRKSVVKDPLFNRINTGDNTPAVIHTEIVNGDCLKISVLPKGFGGENMSAIKMMVPADGLEGVKKFIIDCVDKAGPNPCPPVVVGVGVGGTFEKAALLAKKALLRPVGSHHSQPEVAELEKELLSAINDLGIGPQGLGGRVTALAVHIETYPTHIGGLPVAVNINCNAGRHREIIL
ncbi:fumarate hydratase [Calderihabitans maritimus]|uniref:Fumarate hydratase n=1 Tax=Calderihabitans maritimus TaxID=1246530 RepID=A0A1Z5HTG5_9FIRM|nr:fumarate hydratase [Calderihabitans maritimus]GAW92814.1 fumarate hydratase [Calderihabitans maritimus]